MFALCILSMRASIQGTGTCTRGISIFCQFIQDGIVIDWCELMEAFYLCFFFFCILFIYLFYFTGIRQKHTDQYVETVQNLQQIP